MYNEIKETSTLLERLKEYSNKVPLGFIIETLPLLARLDPYFGNFSKDLSDLVSLKKNFDESYITKNLIIMMCIFRLKHNPQDSYPCLNSDHRFFLCITAEALEPIIDKSIWDRYESKLIYQNKEVFCEQLANMITSEYPHLNVEIDDFGMTITHVNECQAA